MAGVMETSVDESDQAAVAELGSVGAAEELLGVDESYFQLVPGWWKAASDEKGDLVGFVLPVLLKQERAWREGSERYQREHVTPYIYQNPERFQVLAVQGERDYSSFRWTLDTERDLEFLRAVYMRFAGRDDFGWQAVRNLLEREPELLELNRNVIQKALREG